ncbi:MAG: ABC transporter permease [Planctomycetaceae bacterium]
MSALASLTRHFELIALLARKEWHIRYRSAKLGYAWAVLQPFLLMVVMLTVMSFLGQSERQGWGHTQPYSLFLLTGLFPWHFASVALSSATPSFSNSRKLILLAGFPRGVLPLGVVAAHLVNLLATLPLLIPFYLYYETTPSYWLLALPVPIALQTAILAGMSLIAALACVRFTDTFFLVQALLLPWYFATPIFYPRTGAQGLAGWLWLNPLTGVMELYRLCLMPGWPADDALTSLLVASGWAVLLTIFAWWLLRRVESTIADWL